MSCPTVHFNELTCVKQLAKNQWQFILSPSGTYFILEDTLLRRVFIVEFYANKEPLDTGFITQSDRLVKIYSSRDDRYVAFVTEKGFFYVLCLKTKSCVFRLNSKECDISCCAYLLDHCRLACGTHTGRVDVYSTESWKLLDTYRIPDSPVQPRSVVITNMQYVNGVLVANVANVLRGDLVFVDKVLLTSGVFKELVCNDKILVKQVANMIITWHIFDLKGNDRAKVGDKIDGFQCTGHESGMYLAAVTFQEDRLVSLGCRPRLTVYECAANIKTAQSRIIDNSFSRIQFASQDVLVYGPTNEHNVYFLFVPSLETKLILALNTFPSSIRVRSCHFVCCDYNNLAICKPHFYHLRVLLVIMGARRRQAPRLPLYLWSLIYADYLHIYS